MNRTRWCLALGLVAAGVILAGCESTAERDAGAAAVEDRGAPATETGGDASGRDTGVETRGVGEAGGFQGSPLEDPESPLAERVLYFEYDSSEVREQYRPVVQAHARYLSSHPGTAITLEGHADERGSREYNLGLGERRANAVRRQLVLLGASAGQIRTVSYGEERPAVEGHDEAAWSQNRRVEIIY